MAKSKKPTGYALSAIPMMMFESNEKPSEPKANPMAKNPRRVIDRPDDSTDPSVKHREGKLCFPYLVDKGENETHANGFQSVVPDRMYVSNEISGPGRDKDTNLYSWGTDQGSR